MKEVIMSKKLYITFKNYTNSIAGAIDTLILENEEEILNFKNSSYSGSNMFFYKVDEPFKNAEKVSKRSIKFENVLSVNEVETLENALKIEKIEIFKDTLFDVFQYENQKNSQLEINDIKWKFNLAYIIPSETGIKITTYVDCDIISSEEYDAGAKTILDDVIVAYRKKIISDNPYNEENIYEKLWVGTNFAQLEINGITVGLAHKMQEIS